MTQQTTTHEHCDILIIGAGPAGMAAALAAAPSGASIRIVDDNPQAGGQIWRDGPSVALPALGGCRTWLFARSFRRVEEFFQNAVMLAANNRRLRCFFSAP